MPAKESFNVREGVRAGGRTMRITRLMVSCAQLRGEKAGTRVVEPLHIDGLGDQTRHIETPGSHNRVLNGVELLCACHSGSFPVGWESGYWIFSGW